MLSKFKSPVSRHQALTEKAFFCEILCLTAKITFMRAYDFDYALAQMI